MKQLFGVTRARNMFSVSQPGGNMGARVNEAGMRAGFYPTLK